MDLARLTMDIDGAMEEITAVVDAVFKPQPSGRTMGGVSGMGS